MQEPDGRFRMLDEDEAQTIRRLFGAANREAPIFAVGETVEIRSGKFRVLALDGALLVLQGVPWAEAQHAEPDLETAKRELQAGLDRAKRDLQAKEQP